MYESKSSICFKKYGITVKQMSEKLNLSPRTVITYYKNGILEKSLMGGIGLNEGTCSTCFKEYGVTVKQMSEKLNLSPRTIQNYVRSGKLKNKINEYENVNFCYTI